MQHYLSHIHIHLTTDHRRYEANTPMNSTKHPVTINSLNIAAATLLQQEIPQLAVEPHLHSMWPDNLHHFPTTWQPPPTHTPTQKTVNFYKFISLVLLTDCFLNTLTTPRNLPLCKVSSYDITRWNHLPTGAISKHRTSEETPLSEDNLKQ